MDDPKGGAIGAFKSIIVLIIKTFIALILLWLTMRLFTVTDIGAKYFGALLLVFFTLPTVFVVFFSGMTLRRHPGFRKYWRVLKIIYIMLVALFIMIYIIAIVRLYKKDATKKAVDFINSQKITLDDAMGKNLPPAPDQTLNDSTIAGIDANNNGIRDDVELAIFKKYPNSARIRLVLSQYAQALQLEFTAAYNPETWIAILKKKLYSRRCAEEIVRATYGYNNYEKGRDYLLMIYDEISEIEKTILNNNLRNKIQELEKNYDTNISIYTSMPNKYCDIDIFSLPN